MGRSHVGTIHYGNGIHLPFHPLTIVHDLCGLQSQLWHRREAGQRHRLHRHKCSDGCTNQQHRVCQWIQQCRTGTLEGIQCSQLQRCADISDHADQFQQQLNLRGYMGTVRKLEQQLYLHQWHLVQRNFRWPRGDIYPFFQVRRYRQRYHSQ